MIAKLLKRSGQKSAEGFKKRGECVMASTRSITLPEELCSAVELKFGRRFGSLDEFVANTLTHLLRDDALAMDAREQQIIEERLKALGYV